MKKEKIRERFWFIKIMLRDDKMLMLKFFFVETCAFLVLCLTGLELCFLYIFNRRRYYAEKYVLDKYL